MYPDSEQRRGSFGGTLYAAVLVALTGYLTFAALQGEHGLFSLLRVEAQEAHLRQDLAALQSERAVIANKALRLSAGSVRIGEG